MKELSAAGITISLEAGWEADIRQAAPPQETAEVGIAGPLGSEAVSAPEPVILHVGNFRLPFERGDYGGGVLEQLAPGEVFISLIDFGTEAADQPLFAHHGVPTLTQEDFSPNAIVRGLLGKSGSQHFFNLGGRGFCLYVVVGSHRDRADLLEGINATVRSIRVG
jgi:hypothetical protein